MQNAYHIGIVSSLKHPAQPPFAGGTEATAWYVAELLQEHGHFVTYFQTGQQSPKSATNLCLKAPHTHDYEHRQGGAVLKYCEYMENHQPLDVLINLSWIDSFPAACMQGFGPPQVFWLMLPYGHNPHFDTSLIRYSDWEKRRFVVCGQTQAQLEPYRNKNLTAEYITLPVPADKAYYAEDFVLPELPQKPKLVWVGRPTKTKGLDIFFSHAARMGMEAEVWASTGIPNNLLPSPLPDNVRVYSRANPKRITKAIASASAVVVPVRRYDENGKRTIESGSRVVMDSLLSGVPVIATKDGCMVEWITHGLGGALLDEPENFLEFAEAVEDVLYLQEKEEKFRQRIRKHALKLFSRDNLYTNLMYMCEKAMYADVE